MSMRELEASYATGIEATGIERARARVARQSSLTLAPTDERMQY
jgi:hypothetical protein